MNTHRAHSPVANSHNAPFVNERVVDQIVKEIQIRKSDYAGKPVTIADLGCGEGFNAQLLRPALDALGIDYKILCVEIDPKLYKLEDSTGKITFKEANLDKDFAFGEFDFVVATEVVEHLENPYHFFRNCIKNLKKNGSIYVSSPNTTNLYSQLKQFVKGVPSMFHLDLGPGHIMPFNPFMARLITMKMNAEFKRNFQCSISYNRNVLLVPGKFAGQRMNFSLPGGNRLFGEVGTYRISEAPLK